MATAASATGVVAVAALGAERTSVQAARAGCRAARRHVEAMGRCVPEDGPDDLLQKLEPMVDGLIAGFARPI